MKELAARLRNLFAVGEFRRRYDDGSIQVETHNGRAVEGRQAFPYGFCARARGGKTFVICQGGNPDAFEIFPLQADDNVTPPDLNDGDAAIYTADGGYIIIRDSGGVEVKTKGKIYMGNDSTNILRLMCGLIDEIKGLITSGSAVSQAINAASQQKLDLYKKEFEALLTQEA